MSEPTRISLMDLPPHLRAELVRRIQRRPTVRGRHVLWAAYMRDYRERHRRDDESDWPGLDEHGR